MKPYTELMDYLRWQRSQFSRYAVVFVYDDYQRTRAIDRLDVTNEVIRSSRRQKKGVEGFATMLARLAVAALRNDQVLEDMRAAIIAMPDDQWQEIAEGL